jgi:hypothetical protein
MAVAVLALVLTACATRAVAAPIGIDLTATIIYVADETGLLGNALHVGDQLTAKYTYDSATPDCRSESSIGDYWHYTAPYGIVVRAQGVTFQTNPAAATFIMEILNDWHPYDNSIIQDSYVLISFNNLILPGGVAVDTIGWQLDDYGGTVLNSKALPTTSPVLSDWGNNGVNLTIRGTDRRSAASFMIRAFVDSATVSSSPYDPLLPEPATLSLVGLGLAGLVVRRRGSQRK